MKYVCCDDTARRNAVKAHPSLNGIDFLEVVDNPGDPYDQRQTTLLVHFLKPLLPGSLDVGNILITGGERIQNIQVTDVSLMTLLSPPGSPPDSPPASPLYDDSAFILVVKVSEAGDYSTYTLQLVQDPEHPVPPAGFDPILSSVDFSFKVLCPSDFDCADVCGCETQPMVSPSINYLAKDFASFRQLMLDRMAVTAPDWKERNPADAGVTLVELLAYVGDYLSYRQDAIGTEAYLGTARRRVSVRRHVRLVDYLMHDGCNARVWVQLQLGEGTGGITIDRVYDGQPTQLFTAVDALSGIQVIRPGSQAYTIAVDSNAQVFELMDDHVFLHSDHNQMDLYTWDDRSCCLPEGAVSATLVGHYPSLAAGQLLAFIEVLGPRTGVPEDADPTHRVVVRLTDVSLSNDPLFDLPVTEISWGTGDALPFPVCISSRNDTQYFDKVSVVQGNIVLADHGMTVKDNDADLSLRPSIVPQPNPALADLSLAGCKDPCNVPQTKLKPQRYYPVLLKGPLTQAGAYGGAWNGTGADVVPIPASAAMQWRVDSAVPVIRLTESAAADEDRSGQVWTSARDLLEADATTQSFVVEVEANGNAYLRFGDDVMGSRPSPGTYFLADFRVGNGKSGNIGHDTLAHIATADPALVAHMTGGVVNNPLPAQGGVEPEPLEEARQKAPQAFRTQERAVIGADYEYLSNLSDASVQRAAPTLRWTGSWRTTFLSIDRMGGLPVDSAFETSIRNDLEPYRMAGLDLEVDGPVYVSLDIAMNVCIEPGYFGGDVKAALLQVFSSKVLPDGRLGIFHPDNFTFGQAVYLSPLYAAAQAVAGVRSVEFTKFQRQGDDASNAVDSGAILLDRLEIARCDNDPNYPEHGIFKPNLL